MKVKVLSSIILTSLALAGCGEQASQSNVSGQKYQEGINYTKLDSAIPEFEGNIYEFYWYECIHCLSIEDKIDSFNIASGEKVIIKRHSQLFPAAERVAMFDYAIRGLLPENEAKELNHEVMVQFNKGNLDGLGSVFAFLETKGLTRQSIEDYLAKPEVIERMAKMKAYEKSGQFEGTPAFIIDGKFIPNQDKLSNWDEAFELFDHMNKNIITK